MQKFVSEMQGQVMKEGFRSHDCQTTVKRAAKWNFEILKTYTKNRYERQRRIAAWKMIKSSSRNKGRKTLLAANNVHSITAMGRVRKSRLRKTYKQMTTMMTIVMMIYTTWWESTMHEHWRRNGKEQKMHDIRTKEIGHDSRAETWTYIQWSCLSREYSNIVWVL